MSEKTSLFMADQIPEYLASALMRIRDAYDHDLFRNGGCGILATALATLCQKNGDWCEISIIHRYDPVENTDTLSHMTLGLPELGLSLDIDGGDADSRWVELLMDNEILIYGYNRSEFSFQDILVQPNAPAPLRHLQRITEDFQLRTQIMPFYGQVLSSAFNLKQLQAA